MRNVPKLQIIISFLLFLFMCFFNTYVGVTGILLVVAIYFFMPDLEFKKERHDFISDGEYKKNIPFPYVILNNNKIIEKSDLLNFQRGKLLTDYIVQFDSDVAKQTVFFNKNYYILKTMPFESLQEGLDIVFFLDEDMDKSIGNRNSMVVGIIFIDNHDEVLETVEDARRQLLLALIDRKINALSQKVDGIVRKFEKDKYIWIFSEDKLEYLKQKKFDILDAVREIDMGNSIPVTLSIGLGISGNTLAENMEFARAALDLALGRGGDQVLVKDNNGYTFFGGKSKEVGNSTRVRARVKAYALSELVEQSENVLVMGHKNSDFDCLGSAIGLYKIAKAMGKKANIVLNSIPSTIVTLYDRLMEDSQYRENVFISGDEAMERISTATLLIIVDVHRPSLVEEPKLLEKADKIVVFDHHRKNAQFINNAVLTYHEPYASSTCELITEMFMYVKAKIKFKPIEADSLLAGIMVDTKNFNFKTGAKTFEAAAYLRRNGADSVRVGNLFKYDLDTYKVKTEAVSSAEIFHDKMAISVCKSELENLVLITAQAADELLKISDIESSFVLCQVDDRIYISARSLGGVNVQVITEKLGGGGHQMVAGAQFQGISMKEAVTALKNAIEEYLQEG